VHQLWVYKNLFSLTPSRQILLFYKLEARVYDGQLARGWWDRGTATLLGLGVLGRYEAWQGQIDPGAEGTHTMFWMPGNSTSIICPRVIGVGHLVAGNRGHSPSQLRDPWCKFGVKISLDT
jgi:hypothetical protein